MKKRVYELIKHPLFSGSMVMIIGSNVISFLNYLYHLIMVRLLAPPSYGELVALFSLIGFLGILSSSLNLVVTKFVSAAKNNLEISSIVSWLNSKIFIFSLAVFLLITFLSPIISSFLKIENNLLIILIALPSLLGLASLLYKSVLQGLLRFQQMILSVFVENGLKLILGVILVYAGFSVGGAVAGLVIASFIGFFLSRFFIRNFLKASEEKPNIKSMFLYSFPVTVQYLSITSLFSSDILLIKHFFSPHDAGIYAIISTLGKIILFGTGPIGAVMFPLVSQRQARGDNYKRIFFLSFILTFTLAVLILLIYWFIPEQVINLLNPSYLEAAPLLVWYGIFITFFTLSSLFISYYLSLNRVSVVILPFIAAVAQIIGIWFFHRSLFEVILVSSIVAGMLLVLLLIYSAYGSKLGVGDSAGIQTRKNNSQRFKEDEGSFR
ncbi:oligosaccharide flippase family protein [Candidatus Daviesbacteria bacterium]|nr:oligosaccharide flippase family protein [Candidatus Daviesbacteria bacterium]